MAELQQIISIRFMAVLLNPLIPSLLDLNAAKNTYLNVNSLMITRLIQNLQAKMLSSQSKLITFMAKRQFLNGMIVLYQNLQAISSQQ